MDQLDECPVCGGEVVEKQVQELLRGGQNTAVLMVRAEVCLHCGERLYSKETVAKFEEIRRKHIAPRFRDLISDYHTRMAEGPGARPGD